MLQVVGAAFTATERARVALAEVAVRDTLWAEPVAKVEVIMMAGGEVG